ncbi:Oligosaccharide translocation protein rft1 [Tulasnella sp. 331]|nr:Oligosaccharide translocation protein rft1 [Tulasnella sp. 331]KAG8890688.1 Oligosaccharide translocation protein rft1 [Tulasnella sp. 332]
MMATATRQSDNPSTLLSKSLATASSLMALQFLSRIVTFVLNQSLVRLATPAVFGTASIQFELLLSTILFLSREGVRNALLRAPETSRSQSSSQSITNISLLPTLFGIPITAICATSYIYSSSQATNSQPHFTASVVLYALAAMLELLSEPLYIRAQNEMQFGIRVKAEGTAVIVKAVSTLLVLLLAGADWALAAFATGQTVYSLVILSAFVRAYPGQSQLVPKKVTEQSKCVRIHFAEFLPTDDTLHSTDFLAILLNSARSFYFESALMRLSLAMTGQSVVKHFLTEGDKFVLSRISSLENQGGYAVASNYGSLVARIVFQPIEETSRLFFSKTLMTANPTTNTPNQPKTNNNSLESSSSKIPKASPSALQSASTVLHTLLLLDTHIALLLVTFVPPFLPFLLSIILPRHYLLHTAAPRILQVYLSVYLPVMAFNGVLEAFLSSVATPQDLRRQSVWLVGFSVAFVGATWAFTVGLGWIETGLVWANILNLGLRAGYGWIFAQSYFDRTGPEGGSVSSLSWSSSVPPVAVWMIFGLSGIVTRMAQPPLLGGWRANIVHVAIGATCFAMCAITW